MMKRFLIFASIPLALFTVLFAIPRLFADLFNQHTDIGIMAVVMFLCVIFGLIATKLYNVFEKEINNED